MYIPKYAINYLPNEAGDTTAYAVLQLIRERNYMYQILNNMMVGKVGFVKSGVKVVTVKNIELNGEQIIDGVSVVDGDRVLVNSQTNAIHNGVYIVSKGEWKRSDDAKHEGDFAGGFYTTISEGTHKGSIYFIGEKTKVGEEPLQFIELRGPKGETGAAFTFDMFTKEQLQSLKGEKGDPLRFTDLTSEQKKELKGEQGVKGEQGQKGEKGDPLTFADLTPSQKQELKGDKGDKGEPGEKLTFNDLTESDRLSLKGDKGDKLTFADLTEKDKQELKGEKGDPFRFTDFTIEQLQSLKGEKGDQGQRGEKGDPLKFTDLTPSQKQELKGEKGDRGLKGEKGDPFTYNDFTKEQLQALKGEKGERGADGVMTFADLTPEQKESLRGPQGVPGQKGERGLPGTTSWEGITDKPTDLVKQNELTNYAKVTYVDRKLNEKAPKGNYATVEYTDGKIAALIKNAPAMLDTLEEVAKALNNDPNFSSTIMDLLSKKANTNEVYIKSYIDKELGDRPKNADIKRTYVEKAELQREIQNIDLSSYEKKGTAYSKSESNARYLEKSGTAVKALTSDKADVAREATKAHVDAMNNVIHETYMKKSDSKNVDLSSYYSKDDSDARFLSRSGTAMKALTANRADKADEARVATKAIVANRANEADSAYKATNDAFGNAIHLTYLKKTDTPKVDLSNYYNKQSSDSRYIKHGEVVDMAKSDSSGNVIIDTYATKRELEESKLYNEEIYVTQELFEAEWRSQVEVEMREY